MRLTQVMTCALLLSATAIAAQDRPPPATAAAPQAESLTGLWKAERRFGADIQGPLVIERTGGRYTADIAGYVLPVTVTGQALGFELPGRRGRFEGRLAGAGLIRGHWLQPSTPVNGGFGSPVLLRAAARDRWIGEVRPLQQSFTLYLLLRPRPDGSFDAVVRNPERDLGAQTGAQRLVRDGEVVRLMGRRGSGPEREIAAGRLDSESGSFTLALPNRGGTYDFRRDEDDNSPFYPRGRNPAAYVYRQPPERDDGWRTASLREEAIDQPAMERLVQSIAAAPMDSNDAPQIHALLVARHGRLVLEEYFHGYDRDRLHDLRSAAKSVTAVAIGAALQARAPLSLASPVYQVMNGGTAPAGLDPRARAMTLENLLTMSSGWFCDDTNEEAPGNEERMQDQEEEPDWLRYTLRVPMALNPGEQSIYCSSNPNMALGMLGAASGRSPLDWFDRAVAEPMQIGDYAWFLDRTGQPYGGGGVQLRPRDLIKFGQLMLNGGSWEGRRILDPGFARRATSALYHSRNVFYGYLWWVEDYPYKNRTVRSYSARGAGGQWVTVIPELALVVTVLAGNYSSNVQKTYTSHIVPRSILPAVREPGDDPRATVSDRSFTSPYGASTDGSRMRSPAQAPGDAR
ncbi:MAG TPA: serine hydrolase [Allosphingosinicella sp.]|nr:serine hydrolase [Allosphingosinicella sp.]